MNGCPDTDGDGIADGKDACPEVAGLAALNGCPDADGDGVADKDDKCPTVAGPRENGGCPYLDADKDGVYDKDDECPTVAGPASNKGCPEVTAEVLQDLKVQARSIFFNTGKSSFKAGDAATISSLDAIKEILKNYPNAKFSIEGHTDSTGSAKLNQKLSEDRANAVRNVLIEKGVNADNLTAVGYGSSKPVASNKTAKGRAENRRTEVKHVGSKYEGKL
ncbi:Outer membrane porin F precursor [compost metagenome]